MVKCDQCNLIMINGIVCHESSCPNMNKEYINGEWIEFYDCSICGYPIKEGEICSCNEEALEEAFDETIKELNRMYDEIELNVKRINILEKVI